MGDRSFESGGGEFVVLQGFEALIAYTEYFLADKHRFNIPSYFHLRFFIQLIEN